MANTDNSCADLPIVDLFSESTNTLQDIMELQKDIQENVYGYNFEELRNQPIEEMRKFFDWNYHAIQDELRETFDALGGVKDGIGNGVWKPWKKSNAQIKTMKFTDLTPSDLLELKYELIDIQHFINNLMLAVGMDAKEVYNLYFAKNAENRNRQNNNY
jgi:hypothetical protein